MKINQQGDFLIGWKDGVAVAHHIIEQGRTRTQDYVTPKEFSEIHKQFSNYLKTKQNG